MAFPPSVEKNSTHFVQLVFKNQPWDLEDALHGITFPEPGAVPQPFWTLPSMDNSKGKCVTDLPSFNSRGKKRQHRNRVD